MKANKAFYAIVSLFFLWALAHNLNPILIPHLKNACKLSDMQSAWVDSAFYIAYFFMALPAGWLIEKMGYQKTIVLGLALFSAGAFLFIPAANATSYPLFLMALFVVASGLTFLETAANPYVTILGSEKEAPQRLNFAQAFNGLGATIAAFAGSKLILSDNNLTRDANLVQTPYLTIGILVAIVMLLFMRLKLPQIKTDNYTSFSFMRLWQYPQLRKALLAQFVYVGAQVGVGSFFIRYCSLYQISQESAGTYLSISLLLFMCGRFFGSWLMHKIEANILLRIYAIISMALMAFAIWGSGVATIYALVSTQFFMSIMFPTHFTNGLQGLGEDSKYGSSLLVMTISGGAILPPIMGALSDINGIQFAYLVPLFCFAIIAILANNKSKENTH
jgi:FHS family L-fucose permease-like MFS transporter